MATQVTVRNRRKSPRPKPPTLPPTKGPAPSLTQPSRTTSQGVKPGLQDVGEGGHDEAGIKSLLDRLVLLVHVDVGL